MVLEKTLESPWDCKEIKTVHPKGNQSWVSIGRTDVEAETPNPLNNNSLILPLLPTPGLHHSAFCHMDLTTLGTSLKVSSYNNCPLNNNSSGNYSQVIQIPNDTLPILMYYSTNLNLVGKIEDDLILEIQDISTTFKSTLNIHWKD